MFIDSHCHLQLIAEVAKDLTFEKVITKAKERKVTRMLCVATNLQHMPALEHINSKHPFVDISCGVHPNEQLDFEPTEEEYLTYAEQEAVKAVGETGLDYYRGLDVADNQKIRFARQIEVAKACNKPLIIHTRDAGKATIAELKQHKGKVTGVIHCFTETYDFAKEALDLGFYISFSGIVTFKNAKELQDIATKVPLDRILIETDSPYLAPVPYRGKTNQPAYVADVAEFLAKLRKVELSEFAKITTDNYYKLFQI